MRISQTFLVAIIAGLLAAGLAFWKQASANDGGANTPLKPMQADAVFAGGCFWCIEADFEKLPGVYEAISGYTGGHLNNPSYEQVSKEDTGHYEAVRVIYDPGVVSYADLVEYFWRHVDPTDAGGQFCDRGDSYRTAVFVETEEERAIAEASKSVLEGSGILPGPVVTPVIDQSVFWLAEDYHQNYYKTRPLRYAGYRYNCGRDSRIQKVWARDIKTPTN
jgi:peptide-methionine (S)-S-oxide reductase